jgi:hypothetical protein
MANATATSKQKGIAGRSTPVRRKSIASGRLNGRIRDAISIAEGEGLLRGGRTLVVRGRMPAALVARAKEKSGITSDSKLLEAALASMAVADEYGDWLISQRNTVAPDLDLEF